VGHLLTGAGAAGLLKVLLALKHQTLPPTANFRTPPASAGLGDGPFQILDAPRPWESRDGRTPRRAAVNAFGFGGINAHVLVEEWEPAAVPASPVVVREPGIAIVGMEARFGALGSLRAFQEAVFNGRSDVRPLPEDRGRG